MRKNRLLIGAGFFGIILLVGMAIAAHFSALSMFLTLMGFAVFMSILVFILTYNIFTKGFNFKKEIFVPISPAVPPNNTVVQIQKSDINEVVL